MENKRRFHEIDLLKTASIIAVVAIHAISTSFADTSVTGKFLGDFTRFAVPGLLFASGFLFDKTGKSDGALLKKLLLRIFPPYFFWSTIIMVFHLPGGNWGAEGSNFKAFVFNLVFGNAVGIYYFVFVIGYLYGISFLLRRLSKRSLLFIWGLSAGMTPVFLVYIFHFIPVSKEWFLFALMRHPLLHLLPYLSGWVFFLYRESLIQRASQFRTFVLPLILFADVAVLMFNQTIASDTLLRLTIQVHIYLVLFFLLFTGIRYLKPVRPVYFMSQASYGIFLIHFPIVRIFQGLFAEHTASFSIVYSSLSLVAGLLGSLTVIYLGKKILGRYSVYITGV